MKEIVPIAQGSAAVTFPALAKEVHNARKTLERFQV
jgi:hypothetical protein